jgi:putative colanic acid biosynthesis acetyltransferase WcaF
VNVEIKKYDNGEYSPGRNFLIRFIWYYVNALIINSGLVPIRSVKVLLLRLFGARIGHGVNIKPMVNIKYPWNLTVGNYSWIGEEVWIDNLAPVSIGNNVVLSQGAMLLTGNHDYKKSTFDLIVKKIVLEDGVWIGAQAVVCPGVIYRSHSILSVGSVATKELSEYTIYQGNPAVEVKKRMIDG